LSDNIIQFRRSPEPDDGRVFDRDEPVCYATLYPNGVIVTAPDGGEPNREEITGAMFDACFSILEETDEGLALISFGAELSRITRKKDVYATPAQRRWLAQRLDMTYGVLTGRNRSPIRAFLSRLNPFRKG
jgi:hypothetical protein